MSSFTGQWADAQMSSEITHHPLPSGPMNQVVKRWNSDVWLGWDEVQDSGGRGCLSWTTQNQRSRQLIWEVNKGQGFPGGSAGKESACNAEDLGSLLGLGRSPGGGNSYQLPCSGLENSMDWTVQSMGSRRVGHDWVTFIFTCQVVVTLTYRSEVTTLFVPWAFWRFNYNPVPN